MEKNAAPGYREFNDAAQAILTQCKKSIGASAGYVALLNKDGSRNEVVFLDTGGLPCTVDPSLPMPIRGLRAEAFRSGKAIYHNDFLNSKWVKYIPQGHVKIDSALFAPLIVDGKVAGLLGLANKPGGFTENDAPVASTFGEFAAIALMNSRMLEQREADEERFRSVVERATDAIICADSGGNITLWNKEAENVFGYPADEVIGKPLTLIMPEGLREAHRKGFSRAVSSGKLTLIGKTVELTGLKKNGSEFPLELSLAIWKKEEEIFFTAIIRDITERKHHEETERERIRLEEELKERKRSEALLKESEERYRTLFQSTREGILVTGSDGKLLTANPAAAAMLGYENAEELVGIPAIELYYDPKQREALFAELMKRGYVESYELTLKKKDGTLVHVIGSGVVHKDKEDNLLRTEEFFTDITELKQTENELKKSSDAQTALNSLLRLSQEDIPLEELLKQAFEVVLGIEWLALQSRSGIFLVEDEPNVLVMKEESRLPEPIRRACARVPFGRCLCGRAALTREIQFADHIDERHDIRYEGITPHGHYCVPITLPGEVIGVLNLYLREGHRREQKEEEFLMAVSSALADIITRKQIEDELKQSLIKLRKGLDGTVHTLASITDMRDPYTAGHQRRVSQLSLAIAKEINLPEEQIEGIRIASYIHDVGKISVPAEILSKPGKLSDYEFGIIKNHTQVAYDILKDLEFPWPVAKTVLQHHERLNGSGYPQGISGEDIALEARILGVADVVEAMASHRPYRPALGIDKALLEILQKKGTLYDPEVVDTCLRLFTEKGFKFE